MDVFEKTLTANSPGRWEPGHGDTGSPALIAIERLLGDGEDLVIIIEDDVRAFETAAGRERVLDAVLGSRGLLDVLEELGDVDAGLLEQILRCLRGVGHDGAGCAVTAGNGQRGDVVVRRRQGGGQ